MKWKETIQTLNHLYYYLYFRSLKLNKQTSQKLADIYTTHRYIGKVGA